MVILIEPEDKRLPFHSGYRQNIISTSLEEKHVDFFLTNLYAYLDSYLLPAPKHIHVLFYLATSIGSIEGLKPQVTPIDLLDRLSTLHPPSVFRLYTPRPVDTPNTWGYEATSGTIERDAKRKVVRCREDGVFGLFWKEAAKSDTREQGRKRRKRGQEEEETDERVESSVKEVDENAWDLLSFFVRLWKKDQEEYKKAHPDQPALSPLFLDQFRNIPRKIGDMQMERLDHALTIFRSIYTGTRPDKGQTEMIGDILGLILPLLEGTTPIFHPPSFPLAFLPFLRSISTQHLDHFFTLFTRLAPLSITAHLMTILLEDLGGIRVAKAQARRERRQAAFANTDGANNVEDLDGRKGRWAANLAPPSVGYLVEELLPLPPSDTSSSNNSTSAEAGGVIRKMEYFKVRLVMIMTEDDLFPLHEVKAWETIIRRDEGQDQHVLPNDGVNVDPLKSLLNVISAEITSVSA